jgi:hypothetical protein
MSLINNALKLKNYTFLIPELLNCEISAKSLQLTELETNKNNNSIALNKFPIYY